MENDDIGEQGTKGMVWRRGIVRLLLLVSGFGAGFCVLWGMLSHTALAMEQYRASKPVVRICEELSLPIRIEGTTLVAEQLASYDGPFLEDGSQAEVFNVAALLVRNVGQFGVERAEIVLERGEEQFVFEADTIPAGSAVLVLEKNRRPYCGRVFTGCTGQMTAGSGDWSAAGMLSVREVDMGTVAITNLTDRELTDIRLYYKNHLADSDIYVGGRSYELHIPALGPGQTLQISPPYYAGGYSRAVKLSFDG